MGVTIERNFSFDTTKKIAEDFIKKYSKKLKFELVCCKNDLFPTYISYVKTGDGKLVTRGNGKGIGEQSILSGLFESFEHCFYESYFFTKIKKMHGIKFLNYSKIIAHMEKDFYGNPMFENMRTIKSIKRLPCNKYMSLFSKKACYLPLFMYGPSYPYPALNATEATFVKSVYLKDGGLSGELLSGDYFDYYKQINDTMKYCSSVGGASGIDLTETVLHAVNEVIERDTTSEFLLSAVIFENYKKYSLLDKDTLTGSNRKILDYLETSYGLSLEIVNITGHTGIPTIMVYEDTNKFGKETLFTGYGTSTNLEYAIERALLEYKQTIDLVLYDRTLPDDDDYYEVLDKNNVNDFFKKLYYFDYKALKQIPIISFDEMKSLYSDLGRITSPKEMLKAVMERLQKLGYEAYHIVKKYKVKSGEYIYYVKVIIPQMCDITDPGPLRMPNKSMLLRVKGEMND